MLNKIQQKELETAVLCWLATADVAGFPNVSPKEVFCCFNDSTVLVANIASPGTIKNLKYNPKVCLSFVDVFAQRGYQLKGTASLIRERSKCPEAFQALEAIAGPKFPIHSLIWMDVNDVKPILAPTYVMYPETTQQQLIKQAMERYGVQKKKE